MKPLKQVYILDALRLAIFQYLVAHVAMAPTFYVQVQDSPKLDGNWLLNFPDYWTMFYRDASAVLFH